MLVKSFFFNTYLLVQNFSFYLAISVLFWSVFLLFSDLRKKFIWFMFIIILFSIWGFLMDLDGIFLVFLTAEFTIFLLFLMTYLQLYSNYNFASSQIRWWSFLPVLLVFVDFSPQTSYYFYFSFYKTVLHIVSSDFYILYYFLFEQVPVITVIVTLIISFFSLFFIVMYFNLKLVKNVSDKNLKSIYLLRKQLLTKQTTFSNKLYTFQN